MTYVEFINAIIDGGIEGLRTQFATVTSTSDAKLRGGIAGFEACRGQTPGQIRALYIQADKDQRELHPFAKNDPDAYWAQATRRLQIEWVVNCISVVLCKKHKAPLLDHFPTARAIERVNRVVGPNEVVFPW